MKFIRSAEHRNYPHYSPREKQQAALIGASFILLSLLMPLLLILLR